MSTEFTKTVRGASLLERIFIRSMVVLLKIEGNCSCLRAKVAHMVGHLPAAEQWTCSLHRTESSQPSPPSGDCQPPQPAAAGSKASVSSWGVTALTVQTLRLLVQGCWTFARLRSCLPYLQRFLCSRRRQRDHQESTIRRQFLAHPGLATSPSSLFFCSSA